VKRYSALRAALRALTPSIVFRQQSELEREFGELRTAIRELAAALPADAPARLSEDHPVAPLLAKVDAGFESLAHRLRDTVLGISVAQLRASLPDTRAEHPEELCSLLDVCLDDDLRLEALWPYVDYLVTLLATEQSDGRKWLQRDPATLTRRLAQVTARAGECLGSEGAALEQELQQICTELERGEALEPIFGRLGALKKRHCRAVLAPPLLNALVRCNVAVANRIEELRVANRTVEELEQLERLGEGGLAEAAEPAGDAPDAPATPEPAAASALECPGLAAIEAALRARLAQGPQGSDAAAVLAAQLDLGRLGQFEKRALKEPEETSRAVRSAIVVGLILRKLPQLEEPLREVGIVAEVLSSEWVSSLGEALRVEIKACLAEDRYEEGRRVAEIQTKYLSEPNRDVPPPVLVDGPFEATPAPPRRPQPKAKGPAAPARRPRLPRWRRALLVVGLVGAGVAAVLATRYDPTRDVEKVYTAAELAAISPYLATGYMDRARAGLRFVGTVTEAWAGLEPQPQAAARAEIVKMLVGSGLEEIMLFDDRRRLQGYYTDGRLQFPPQG
jgi:hypothetical protein